jgi:c-di-AMP phosphodiesterase-like protein
MCSIENNPFIDRLEAFQGMSHSPSITAACQDIIDSINRDARAFQDLLSAFGEYGFGLTLANDAGTQWTVILQDMTDPTRFRHQTFDERGFFGHFTMDNIEEVIEDAIDQGYRTIDNGRLESLCTTEAWEEGSRACALIHQLNNGQINWSQFTAKMEGTRAHAGA